MPLTDKGAEIKGAMQEHYGDKKGEQVFYASKNAGKITGVDEEGRDPEGKFASGGGEGGGEKKPERKEGGKEIDPTDLIESTAGPALAAAFSDADKLKLAGAEKAFDNLRDRMHKFDRRLDDCAATDDRSSEGHAKAAAQLPEGLQKQFHQAEVGRTD